MKGRIKVGSEVKNTSSKGNEVGSCDANKFKLSADYLIFFENTKYQNK